MNGSDKLEISLDDFLDDGIIKEATFRTKVDNYQWSNYSNKKVIIKGCSQSPIPTWAYLIITYKLSLNNAMIYFGEKCSAIKIN